MFHTSLHIDPQLRTVLSQAGLTSYEQFIGYRDGELVSRTGKNPVRALDLMVDGKSHQYFLKQSPTVDQRVVIKHLSFGNVPQSRSYSEMRAVRYYQSRDIPVMRPVRWGQRRLLGWPLSGFLLVEGSKGIDLQIKFSSAGSSTRRKLARCYGALIGFMHKLGVIDAARCRDVICTEEIKDFRS